MNLRLPLTIALSSLMPLPVMAADFFCPAPQNLPATLDLPEVSTQADLHDVQAFLTNLKAIRIARANARREPQKNEITNCLMDHLYALYENGSLQKPRTRADGATWFLLREEAIAALDESNQRALQFKPQLPFITKWLNHLPAYVAGTPYAIARR